MDEALAKLQRSSGSVRLSFKRQRGATEIAALYQEGASQVRFPSRLSTPCAESILINTAGGLTDGDTLSAFVEWQADTSAVITTQAAERIYKSRGESAYIHNRMVAADKATADWLPQETIVFDAGRLNRTTELHIDRGASVFAAEMTVFGRTAMGEVFRSGGLFDRWRIVCDNRLMYADTMCFDDRLHGDLEKHLAKPAVAGGATCVATVFFADPNCIDHLDSIRATVKEADIGHGASHLGALVVCRILTSCSQDMRRIVANLFESIRESQIPRAWNC